MALLQEIIYVFLETIQVSINFTYPNISLNQFSCIITTRNVLDSISGRKNIHDTCNMPNHNINYMSIAIKKFTNGVNVKSSDIAKCNCTWGKATLEDKRDYQLQLYNNLKQLIDF